MGRAPCCDKDGLKKGPWLPEEDQKLTDYIQKHGPGNWRTLPKKAGLQRCGKSCRLRWTNYLRPDIKRGRFSFEEEETIIQLHSVLGNKWSAIAAKLPGRTDNEIKNYWNTHIRKRLLRMGIDPVTHTRRLDFLDLPSILINSPQSPPQLNLLKLLGLQSLVNPELLRLATLLSTNQNENLNSLLQNLQSNQQQQQLGTSAPLPNQYNPIVQTTNQIQTPIQTTPCVQNLDQQYQQNISNFDAQNIGAQTNQWQSNDMLKSETPAAVQDLDDQAFLERLLNDTDFQSDNKLHGLSSVFSSPSSSQQTPLSSNSGCPNNSSSTNGLTGSEDEIDSYCENLMNFDFPVDLFGVCNSLILLIV